VTYAEAKDFVLEKFTLVAYKINGLGRGSFIGRADQWNVDEEGLAVSHQTTPGPNICSIVIFESAGHITFHDTVSGTR
jgi:hypothetical protein